MNKENEIMYCKDCMWYDTESEWSFGNKHMCIFHDLLCSPDDFCSWAKKDETLQALLEQNGLLKEVIKKLDCVELCIAEGKEEEND